MRFIQALISAVLLFTTACESQWREPQSTAVELRPMPPYMEDEIALALSARDANKARSIIDAARLSDYDVSPHLSAIQALDKSIGGEIEEMGKEILNLPRNYITRGVKKCNAIDKRATSTTHQVAAVVRARCVELRRQKRRLVAQKRTQTRPTQKAQKSKTKNDNRAIGSSYSTSYSGYAPATGSSYSTSYPDYAPATLPPLDMSRTVRVRGYTRKDGTYVRPHTRSTPSR